MAVKKAIKQEVVVMEFLEYKETSNTVTTLSLIILSSHCLTS